MASTDLFNGDRVLRNKFLKTTVPDPNDTVSESDEDVEAEPKKDAYYELLLYCQNNDLRKDLKLRNEEQGNQYKYTASIGDKIESISAETLLDARHLACQNLLDKIRCPKTISTEDIFALSDAESNSLFALIPWPRGTPFPSSISSGTLSFVLLFLYVSVTGSQYSKFESKLDAESDSSFGSIS